MSPKFSYKYRIDYKNKEGKIASFTEEGVTESESMQKILAEINIIVDTYHGKIVDLDILKNEEEE